MPSPIREQALEAIRLHMVAVTAGQPVDDPYEFAWVVVSREFIGAERDYRRSTLGIYDGQETKTAGIQHMTASLNLIFEWSYILEPSVSAGPVANRITGEIQRRVREGMVHASGNPFGVAGILNIVETGNELRIEDRADKLIEGAVFWTLLYRHALNDPRRVV